MKLTDFDIINPLDGGWGRAVHCAKQRFTLRADGDFTGYEIEKMLRRYGIRIWGREMNDKEEHAFLVKRRQALWAEYLLCRAGVPLTCALLDPRNAHYREHHPPRSMPVPWTKHGVSPSGFVGHVLDLLDKLLP